MKKKIKNKYNKTNKNVYIVFDFETTVVSL